MSEASVVTEMDQTMTTEIHILDIQYVYNLYLM